MTKEEFDKLWARLPEKEELLIATKFATYCNFHKDVFPSKDYKAYNIGYRIGYRDSVNKSCNLFYTRLVTFSEMYSNNGFRLDVFRKGYDDGFERGKENIELRNLLFGDFNKIQYKPYSFATSFKERYSHIDWKVKPEDHIKPYCAADCSGVASVYNYIRKDMEEMAKTITKIVYNPPATIVFFGDNSKSVVKCRKDEKYDAAKGVAMAIVKHWSKSTEGHHWYDIFKVVDHQTIDGTDIEKNLVIYVINKYLKDRQLYKKDHLAFKNLDEILKEFPYVPQEKKKEAADILEKKSQETSTIEVTIDAETGLKRIEEIAKVATKEEELQEEDYLPCTDEDAEDVYQKGIKIPESDKINYRLIFELYEYQKLTADEIAKRIGTNVATVCRSLHTMYPEEILGEIRRTANSNDKKKIDQDLLLECIKEKLSIDEIAEMNSWDKAAVARLYYKITGEKPEKKNIYQDVDDMFASGVSIDAAARRSGFSKSIVAMRYAKLQNKKNVE